LFRSCAAKPQLVRQVAAQRARDKEQRLAVLDRFAELPMRAREKRRSPRLELIRLQAAREQDRVPPVATELAFQRAWTDRRDRAESAQAKQIKPFELLSVERQLTRAKTS